MNVNQGPDGKIWLGLFNGGVSYFDPSTRKFKNCNNAIFKGNRTGDQDVRVVLPLQNGEVYVGSTLGLYTAKQSSNGQFEMLTDDENRIDLGGNSTMPIISVLSLYEAADGKLWIGTDGSGIFKLDLASKGITTFPDTTNSPLSHEVVKSIVGGDDGNVWVCGKNAIYKVDLATGDWTMYDENDGLLDGFSPNSMTKAKDGTIYLGSSRGLNVFKPGTLPMDSQQPDVYLSGIKLFNKEVLPGDESGILTTTIATTPSITLTAEQSVISLDYAGISMTRPTQTTYAYRLIGFNNQ